MSNQLPRPLPGLLVAALLLNVSPAPAADLFRLEVPGDESIQSTAVLEDGRLTVNTNGRVHVYTAHPRHDSADGAYRAYYSEQSRQLLRWPVRGVGSMFIGQANGANVAWRESRMQVVPLRGETVRPVLPQVRPHHEAATPSLAVLRDDGGAFTSAIIDSQGVLQMYTGRQGQWRHRPQRVRALLVPQAPLVLANERGLALPTVYTISQNGTLISIDDGRITGPAADQAVPSFVPGTHLATIRRGRHTILFAVDTLGRVCEFDTGRSRFEVIESRAGFFQPGSPIAAMRASEDRVYLVDLRGNLIEYHLRVAGWSRPALVADGFPPSCPVAAGFLKVDAAPGAYLAAVDSRGRLGVLHETRAGWEADVIDDARMTPLAPMDLANVDGRLSLCGVDSRGRWIQWLRDDRHWHQRAIAEGLPGGTPVALFADPTVALAVDHSQRLIAGQLLDDQWECTVCTPTADLAPRLLSRRVIANPPLEPVMVNFVNSHSEPLIAHVYGVRNAGSPRELKIPPGGSVSLPIERDPGATFEEVYLDYDGTGQQRERVQRLPIPPRSLYTIVVNVERVTSVYFDRTRNKSSVPDKVSTSEVSLGTFRLPAGTVLNQGDQIDLPRRAQAQRNPGARSLIEATSRP